MHGTIMLLLFATPLFIGFAQRDHAAADRLARRRVPAAEHVQLLAVPVRRPHRASAASSTPGGAASFGWFAYAPLNDVVTSPGVGADLWIMGLALGGLGTILGGVNFITTIFCMRAPGMTMFRMPIFTWNILVTSILVLLAFPVLAAALLVLEVDRKFGAHVFDAGQRRPAALAAPVLVLRPPRGLHHRAAVLRHRLRDPPGVQPQADLRLQGPGLRDASRSPRCRSTVWAHHMYVTGGVLLPFFAFMTMLIAVPDRREVLQLDRHDVARAR